MITSTERMKSLRRRMKAVRMIKLFKLQDDIDAIEKSQDQDGVSEIYDVLSFDNLLLLSNKSGKPMVQEYEWRYGEVVFNENHVLLTQVM